MVSYQGDTKYCGREMVALAFDIGTTSSAVSYTYLYPNDYARANVVTRWPGQPESVGSSKACQLMELIPTLLAYRNGECKAIGAEALEHVDDSYYDMAKWFKLHLHPPSMKRSNQPPPYGSLSGASSFEIPPLPPSVTFEQVYADFMRYLMVNVERSFEQTIPNGAAIWRRLRDAMVVILTTPNGWDFTQQNVLRNAAIKASLVAEEKAYDLLEFVTEGEASVHYILAYSQSKIWLAADTLFAVIDAGGSTVDSTLYDCKSIEPKVVLEEACESECVQAGGVFVDRAAEVMFKQKLAGTKYGEEDYIVDMVTAFEGRTKRLFDGKTTNYAVDFGSTRDNDRPNRVIKGRLSLTATEIGSTFEDVIKRIMDSCLHLLSGQKVKYILLVGGFGESAYLRKTLTELFESQGAMVITVEEQTKKAAAEGAVIWYIKQSVAARISRTTLGSSTAWTFNPEDREHRERRLLAYVEVDGSLRIPSRFSALIRKGTRIENDFAVQEQFYLVSRTLRNSLTDFRSTIIVYDGDDIPRWITDIEGKLLPQMRHLCDLKADMSGLQGSLQPLHGSLGPYYKVAITVAIRLGGTKLQARLQWEENGIPREGPITLVPGALE
ncbi:hypothetical protein M408DRAFT_26524 [Serendipita vermifera MAFF 305830]|uniref:Actin-like ATPase domain-containing protein n=1 Tax=Serendipita vermifera MAFF 305830 TaxID=933852 RepID=A0A0C3AYT7_SERVB|nr:hypothetical protein M408DRAFT_26524 [Serendipita vermifera MAFF 305830]